MAEVVHRNLESMLPELEELERSGIFSHEEIRVIVRRRRNLEYRLLRRPAKKEDFLRAIQYEVNLDLLRRHRKKKLGVVSTRNDAEHGIQNRIHSLFERALKKFKGDLKLWLQYIEFSKRSQHRLSLGRTFGKALAIHPNKAGLWVMAAKFEFEEQKDVSSARVLLQQGLRANPCSKHLWLEYFRMELMHIDKIKKRRNVLGLDQEEDEMTAASDELLAFKTASIVYKQALKAIPDDLEFRLSFLPIYQLFDGTGGRQEEVYLSIREDFPSHPLCWDALARRPWCGVDRVTLTDKEITELEAKSEEVFREGMEATQNGVAPIWEKYIQWCMERVQLSSQSDTLHNKAVQRLLAAYKQAASNHCLSELTFEQYVQSLQGLGKSEEASDAAVLATEAHPHSASMWLLRLRTHCGVAGGTGAGGSHDALCRDALEQVPRESSLPLWQHWIEHSIAAAQSPDADTETIFQAGTDCGVPSIRGTLSPQYLDWAMMTGGIRKARRVYRRLLEVQPVQYSMYEKCLAVEKLAEKPSMRRIRDLFERAVRDHGSQHPGLWLQYICAEMEMSGGKVESIGKLHWRAANTLQPKLTAEFITQYSLLQTVK